MLCCVGCKESPEKDKKKQVPNRQGSPSKENLVENQETLKLEKQNATQAHANPAFDSQRTDKKSPQVNGKAPSQPVVSPNSVIIEDSSQEIDAAMAAEIAGLVSRLEAVTTRLEGISGGGGGGAGGAGGAPGE